MDQSTNTAAVVYHSPRWLFVAVVVWVCVTATGIWLLWRYAGTASARADAASSWPAGAQVERSPSGATLVMFAHPKCPCTRASIAELERIMSQCGGQIKPWIVFYKPADADADWPQTDLWRRAESIPGAHVIADVDGSEARRFHAFTSGQTFLYGPHGELQFSGGITAFRGHEGDNAGHAAIVQLINGGDAPCRATPVFGCPITETSAPE